MAENKEPQSYGSQGDWSSGQTGQKVNDPKAAPPPQHADFYDERRESETNAAHEHQGGSVSPVQMAENLEVRGGGMPSSDVDDTAGKKHSGSGGGYFKKRDYE